MVSHSAIELVGLVGHSIIEMIETGELVNQAIKQSTVAGRCRKKSKGGRRWQKCRHPCNSCGLPIRSASRGNKLLRPGLPPLRFAFTCHCLSQVLCWCPYLPGLCVCMACEICVSMEQAVCTLQSLDFHEQTWFWSLRDHVYVWPFLQSFTAALLC